MLERKRITRNPEIFIQEVKHGWDVLDANGKRLTRAITEEGAKHAAVNYGRRFAKWPKEELEKMKLREYQMNVLERGLLMRPSVSFE